MKQTGIKQFDDIELKDFEWKIKGVSYDWENDHALVEVHAWEKHKVHSRTFIFPCAEQWTAQDAIDALMTLDTFKNSIYGRFNLGGIDYDSQTVVNEMKIHSKRARNLNTAMDVYFTFREVVYGIRFQDWNIFSTLSDQQCFDRLVLYLRTNGEIIHPAKPLEQ